MRLFPRGVLAMTVGYIPVRMVYLTGWMKYGCCLTIPPGHTRIDVLKRWLMDKILCERIRTVIRTTSFVSFCSVVSSGCLLGNCEFSGNRRHPGSSFMVLPIISGVWMVFEPGTCAHCQTAQALIHSCFLYSLILPCHHSDKPRNYDEHQRSNLAYVIRCIMSSIVCEHNHS